ncbi:MAG: type II toxin-antitoxin system RelE/ParE family toxin [Deltaproteobacteria bacterium]|nr:MAG: type II toxin-antitoxin system RelE/ParE family toxin [Deltaproteobacteria bacterium]
MVQVHISRPAEADLEHIFAVSLERWGEDGRARYLALVKAAFHAIASDPKGPTTRDRSALLAGTRSLHLRHVPGDHRVRDPVHVIFYRAGRASVEIVRVLHERMDPGDHLPRPSSRRRARRR